MTDVLFERDIIDTNEEFKATIKPNAILQMNDNWDEHQNKEVFQKRG